MYRRAAFYNGLKTCTQIAFCAWASSCGPAPECSWFKTSACTSTTVATSEQQDLCVLAQSVSACADMDFCEWKDDCRECSKLTANRDCVSRDFCVWDQGTLPKYPITSADIAFTVASLLCELYTAFRLLKVIFLPPSLCTIASASLRYANPYVSGTRVWTCSLISGDMFFSK